MGCCASSQISGDIGIDTAYGEIAGETNAMEIVCLCNETMKRIRSLPRIRKSRLFPLDLYLSDAGNLMPAL